ncbi:DUF1853 family protein [Cochleicola gelatinilyticus]|uniref:DUF1853 domain-containing protein n=1 Tax=Cochleicola gelatinilyticus TaxID=1763537 RepID=A0A167EQI2_9FLAO|nr:DUF1853 family protein [Cochleicola gelatinilyticus]OAB75777.1 hypothetical protein ULVI_14980 [Cochleicola gelatinilyticus]
MLTHFLAIPELDLTSEGFRYATFYTSEKTIASEGFEFPRKRMVGKQAEYCFEHYLKHHPSYELLAANIQIQGATETIGELDYIIKNRISDKLIHIELACKFYLFDPNLNTANTASEVGKTASWIGPNRKDTLSEKLSKLSEKQFPLLYKAETLSVLEKMGVSTQSMDQQVCLKAMLFFPKQFNAQDLLKEYQQNIEGYYISFTEFLKEINNEATYAIPDKKEWLLPVEELEKWHFFSEISTWVEVQLNKKKSPLLYKKSGEHIEKFFVVWW